MGMYFLGCCFSGYIWPFASLAAWSYDTGRITDAEGSGQSLFVSPPQQLSAGPAATSITLNGTVDDLGVLIPPGGSITAVYNSSGPLTTVTLPANYLILDDNLGGFDHTVVIHDGTHTTTVTAGTSASTAAAQIIAAGFTHAAIGSPIPMATLRSLGIADVAGNLSFQVGLAPAGTGNVTITSASMT